MDDFCRYSFQKKGLACFKFMTANCFFWGVKTCTEYSSSQTCMFVFEFVEFFFGMNQKFPRVRLPTGSRRVDAWSNNFFERPSKLTAFFFILRTHKVRTVTISRVHELNFYTVHRGSRTSSRLKHMSSFLCAPPKQGLSWSCRLAPVECAMSFPHHSAHFANKTECTSDNTLVGSGSRNTQCATSPRSGIWVLGQIHSTSTLAFRPFFAVSIARNCSTWSVRRLLGATPRWKSVLSQLFRTFVPLFASVSCRGSSGNVFCFSLLLLGLSIVRRSFGSAPFPWCSSLD